MVIGANAAEHDTDVTSYCAAFGEAYADANAPLAYLDGSASTTLRSDVMDKIQNLFQPQGSKFLANYDCEFDVSDGERDRSVAVGLFLVETYEFALFTQCDGVQLIPIEHVSDPESERSGFGVFKYFDGPR